MTGLKTNPQARLFLRQSQYRQEAERFFRSRITFECSRQFSNTVRACFPAGFFGELLPAFSENFSRSKPDIPRHAYLNGGYSSMASSAMA